MCFSFTYTYLCKQTFALSHMLTSRKVKQLSKLSEGWHILFCGLELLLHMVSGIRIEQLQSLPIPVTCSANRKWQVLHVIKGN